MIRIILLILCYVIIICAHEPKSNNKKVPQWKKDLYFLKKRIKNQLKKNDVRITPSIPLQAPLKPPLMLNKANHADQLPTLRALEHLTMIQPEPALKHTKKEAAAAEINDMSLLCGSNPCSKLPSEIHKARRRGQAYK